jgi:hypothetical protein
MTPSPISSLFSAQSQMHHTAPAPSPPTTHRSATTAGIHDQRRGQERRDGDRSSHGKHLQEMTRTSTPPASTILCGRCRSVKRLVVINLNHPQISPIPQIDKHMCVFLNL